MLIMGANVFEAPCSTQKWKGTCLLLINREHSCLAASHDAATPPESRGTEHNAVGTMATFYRSVGGERAVGSTAALHRSRGASARGRGCLRGAAINPARAQAP